MSGSGSAIRARGLCYAYPGREVLHDVDVELESGAVTAFTGPNGSGKSTLLELLAGIRTPRLGRVERHGEVALVVQRPAAPETLPLTVRDTVAMGTWGQRLPRRTVRDTVAEMLDVVGLTGLGDRPLDRVSSGQRQRTFLAQALARRADIVLMDEPDAGLDAASRRRIHELLVGRARSGGVAVGCATHDDDLVVRADHVIRLESGRTTTNAAPTRPGREQHRDPALR